MNSFFKYLPIVSALSNIVNARRGDDGATAGADIVSPALLSMMTGAGGASVETVATCPHCAGKLDVDVTLTPAETLNAAALLSQNAELHRRIRALESKQQSAPPPKTTDR